MKARRKVAAIIAAALCVILLLGTIMPALVSSAADTNTKIKDLQNELSGLSGNKKQLKEEIASYGKDIAKATEVKNNLDKQIELLSQEIEMLNDLIAGLNEQLFFKEAQLEVAQSDIENQYELLKLRIKATYEAGGTGMSYIDMLLSSDSYASFLINMDIVASIIEYDNRVLEEFERSKAELEVAKAEVEAVKIEQEAAMESLRESKDDLDVQKQESQRVIKELINDEAAAQKSYKKIEAEEQALKDNIKKLMAELSRATYVGGEFLWPLPGITNITCQYGMRIHPITKVYKLHTGVDVGAPYGTKILAANSGTVITAGYNSAYGNYVVIDHGGGIATLYAHLSKIVTSKNKKVVRGDHIGNVGSTGMSTGNHLHFEIIKNGSTIDPMKQFKKVG